MDWDAYIGRNKYGIYAGLMVASAIAMLASQKPVPASTVKPADGYYANCTVARAAGVTPIMRGEHGYRPELDRDRDGVACEPWTTAENR